MEKEEMERLLLESIQLDSIDDKVPTETSIQQHECEVSCLEIYESFRDEVMIFFYQNKKELFL